jgi:replicative DNA helicase
MNGYLYDVYNDEELQLIDNAVKRYKSFSDHIFIVEGIGNVTAKTIRDRVERHQQATGRVPVVLVDYLQIIAPEPLDARSTDKQIVDKAVLSLKRLSRDFSTPVIGISSFNRDNYYQSVNLTSFKESGAIEYSSDVLIGLQYKTMERKSGESDEDRRSRVREELPDLTTNCGLGKSLPIQVKVLKNRNGTKGNVDLDFYPMFNTFRQSCDKTVHNTSDLSVAFDAVAENGVADIKKMAAKCGIKVSSLRYQLGNDGEYIFDKTTVKRK